MHVIATCYYIGIICWICCCCCWFWILQLKREQDHTLSSDKGTTGILSQLQISIIVLSGSWKNSWSTSIPFSSTLLLTYSISICWSLFSTAAILSHYNNAQFILFSVHYTKIYDYAFKLNDLYRYIVRKKNTWKEMWLSLGLMGAVLGMHSGSSDWRRCMPMP